jgi:tetratricopeptide (TPR) repeat protein
MSEGLRQRAEALLASVERQSPELVRLAEVLSLAVRVEPALLRKARLTLTPKLAVSGETDLWFGPLVESSGAGGFVFRWEVLELLRERLAQKPVRLAEAWKLTRSFHPFIPPSAALEEEVTWASLAGHSEDELARKLGRALTAMLSNSQRGVGIARWALRALPRLPERARSSESAALLAMGTVSRVDGSWLWLNEALPKQLPSQVWRVLGSLPTVTRRLVRAPEGITFLEPEASEGQRLELPDTRPPLLELAWEEDDEPRRKLVIAEPGMHHELPSGVERLQLRALDGHRWELTAVLEQEQQVATAPSGEKVQVFISAKWPASLRLRHVLAPHLPEIVFTVPSVGDNFSYSLSEALLEASLVIVVADAAYWTSEHCRRELQVALLPYTQLPRGSSAEARRSALEHIVLVRPEHGFEKAFDELPRELLQIHWPAVDDISGIAAVLRVRLGARLPRLRERLKALGLPDTVILNLRRNESRLPPPLSLDTLRYFPKTLPPSFGNEFVGRDDALWRLHYLLAVQAESTPPIVSVEGMGGVGKTRLALEYIHRFGPRHFTGGIFWVDADASDDRLEEQFHGILRTLQPDTPALTSFRKRGRHVTLELAIAIEQVAQRAPILYVIDFFPGPWSVRIDEVLSRYCPGFRFASVIVTTRQTLAYGHPIPALKPFSLDPLDLDSAVELLTQGAERTLLRTQEWQAIAQWVGNLPLALNLLNRLLRDGRLSGTALFERLHRDPMRFLEEHSQGGGSRPPMERSLTEILEDTFAGLPVQERQLAQFIAWFAPAPVPIALLKEMDSRALAVIATGEKLAFLTRETVEKVPVLQMGSWLIAAFIRSKSPQPVAELMRVCRSLLAIMEPDSLRDPTRWPMIRACLPHAEDVFNRLREFPLGDELVDFVELGIRVSRFLLAEGRPARARPFAGEAHEHAAEVLGIGDRRTIEALACFAAVERSENHLPEARRFYEQRRDHLAQALRSTEHPDFFVATMDLGETLLAQGDLDGARQELESALVMSNRLLGGTHARTAIAKALLAQVLQQQGRFEDAMKLYQEALETLHQALGRDHLDTLTAGTDLAAVLAALGQMSSARQVQEEVLERAKKLLRDEHPLTVRMTTNLASILEAQGQREQAVELRARVAEHLLEAEEEEHREGTLSFPPAPDDVELQELISDRFFTGETPDALSEMGHVVVRSVDVTSFEEGEVVDQSRVIHGGGSVGVELMVGKDGLSDSFPFNFTVEQRTDGSLHITDLTVNNSAFYAGQEDFEDGGEAGPKEPPEEASEAEPVGRDDKDKGDF